MREELPRKGNPEADAVRAELARARRSQGDAAKQLNLSQPAMSRRLTGEVDFTVAEIRSLADWLGIPVAALIGPEAVPVTQAGYAQPTALGAAVLFLSALLLAWTTAPGVGFAAVAAVGVSRLAFLVGRGVWDAERAASDRARLGRRD